MNYLLESGSGSEAVNFLCTVYYNLSTVFTYGQSKYSKESENQDLIALVSLFRVILSEFV